MSRPIAFFVYVLCIDLNAFQIILYYRKFICSFFVIWVLIGNE